jgi:hypothetical protein
VLAEAAPDAATQGAGDAPALCGAPLALAAGTPDAWAVPEDTQEPSAA